MKKLHSIVLVAICGALALASCTRDLENRVGKLEKDNTTISGQIATLEDLKTTIEARIASLETAGFAKDSDLKALKSAADALDGEILKIKKNYTTTADLEASYVKLAVYNQTANILADVKAKVDGIDAVIDAKIGESLNEVLAAIASIKGMVQSIVFIPEYQGGVAVVKTIEGKMVYNAAFKFAVTPNSAAQGIVSAFAKDPETVAVEWKSVKVIPTKADIANVLEVKSVSLEDAENGIISVIADVKPVESIISADDEALAICLHFKDTITDIRSNYADVVEVAGAAHANCYMAKPGSTVTIETCKGNSDEVLESDAASLVWQDNAALVKSVAVAGNKITVELNDAQEGNAVVAASKEGTIVWSWHIWVANESVQDVTIGEYTFMDRNVGALTIDEKSEKSIGVNYQYGRKDPFPGIKGYDSAASTYVISQIYNAEGAPVAVDIKDNTESNNIANSVKNPQIFYKNYFVSGQKHNYSWITTDATTFDPEVFKGLWENNGVKSVYDPCPAGYKVASIAAWEAVKAQPATEIWDDTYVTPDASAIGTYEKYVIGNKKKVQFRGCIYGGLRLTATGEVNANTGKDKFEFAIANCVGKALPTAEVWCADIDPDFPAKLSASYFRGTAVKVNTTGNGNFEDISAIKVNALSTAGKYGLHYALPVRCIKE